MDEVAIALNRVSKCFKRYARPIDRLQDVLLPGRGRFEEFWALREIDLMVHRGETLGIVGRNGSGKSTLLQMIAGTLTATLGEVTVHGRVSALLELGSGFNPEFTGRQNVFFNGQLLGLTPRAIAQKFDSIAAFADIGDFMEQPVKTYSSGMFVRLAFAVAIATEPDILVIDEALAVGDEAFQGKCFSRLRQFQELGRTILFVSHAASSVVQLCHRAILLDHGELLLQGVPKRVVAQYQKLVYAPPEHQASLRQSFRQQGVILPDAPAPAPDPLNLHGKQVAPLEAYYDARLIPKSCLSFLPRGAEILQPVIQTLEGKPVNVLVRNGFYRYCYTTTFTQACRRIRFGMLIKTLSGFELGGSVSHPTGSGLPQVAAGEKVTVAFEFHCTLLPGTYFLNAGVLGDLDGTELYLHRYVDAVMFRVQPEVDLLATTIVDFQVDFQILPPLEVQVHPA